MLDPQTLCECGGKEAAAASLLSPAPACSLETAPRSTPASTCQQNWLASIGRLRGTRAHPTSWGWRPGTCPSRDLSRVLACGHKQHRALPYPFQSQGKGGPGCPRQVAVPHTGRSLLLPAPWRSSLIQSQHNGAELAPLILLGRRSSCTVGIGNGFLPCGTGSQDSALHRPLWWKPSSSFPTTRNVPVEQAVVLRSRAMAAATQGN